MATLNFIKGTLTGRVGQFVGSSWRGKPYMKTFTPPGNPRTEGQVAIRTVFNHTALIAKALNEGVLKPYTFPRPQKMSAFNMMIKINKPMFEAKEFKPELLKIFDGPLPHSSFFTVKITDPSASSELVTFNWDYRHGELSDLAIPILYDEVTGSVLFGAVKREDGEYEMPTGILSPINRTKLHAYLVFVQPPTPGTNETGLVSGTAYKKL